MDNAKFRRLMTRHQACFDLMMVSTVTALVGGICGVIALIVGWTTAAALCAVAVALRSGMAVWMHRLWRFWDRQLQSDLHSSASALVAHL